MYQNLAILSVFILLYSLFAKRIEKTSISGPILAVLFGVIAGPLLLNILNIQLTSEGYKTFAELALALVLFTDASNTNLKVLEHNIGVPTRLLLIGLPLTIAFGIGAGFLIFNEYSWIEVGILATMLAPTDAALGKAVVTNPKVPSKIREALNVESGLNDGISVPILFLLIAFFTATSIDDVSLQFGLGLFTKEIGVGLAVGLIITFIGDWLTHQSAKHKWISDTWKPIIIIALAFSCFAMAQVLGGSGFIACFSGGLLYGAMNKKHKMDLLKAAEGAGDTFSMITWIIFGAMVIVAYLPDFSWPIVLYAILSLTIIRILPVFISLIKTGFSVKEKLFMGWFGPRGLASIVFAIIVLDIPLPHKPTIILTVVCTILGSIILHGFSAIPFISILNKSLGKNKN